MSPLMSSLQVPSQRRQEWRELELLCHQLESLQHARLSGAQLERFAFLYRSACADLALADAYQLPPEVVDLLHQLVGRAHNQLYRSRQFRWDRWSELLILEAPRRILGDQSIRLAFIGFWTIFLLSALLASRASRYQDFAERLLPQELLDSLETSFADPSWGRDADQSQVMAAFYIRHNTGIGLQCFAGGLLFLPGLAITIYNAALLGAVFGYMSRPDVPGGENFFEFVTAHGPFELTAIVLCAGAGLKLGSAWVYTAGLDRLSSLRSAARDGMLILGAAMTLFVFAALIEGFISPSSLPYWFKAATAVLSSLALTLYFVQACIPRWKSHAT